jgi:hypothetical protein
MGRRKMIRCKDCKWWSNKDAFCKCPKVGWDDDDLKTYSDVLIIRTSGDLYAYIQTGANFGCVHGELREENN